MQALSHGRTPTQTLQPTFANKSESLGVDPAWRRPMEESLSSSPSAVWPRSGPLLCALELLKNILIIKKARKKKRKKA